jgi:hypothetical protein
VEILEAAAAITFEQFISEMPGNSSPESCNTSVESTIESAESDVSLNLGIRF